MQQVTYQQLNSIKHLNIEKTNEELKKAKLKGFEGWSDSGFTSFTWFYANLCSQIHASLRFSHWTAAHGGGAC